MANERGAPVVPAGFLGSISHKSDIAVALVTPHEEGSTELLEHAGPRRAGVAIGIDIEQRFMGKHDISSHVLTERELSELSGMPQTARGEQVMLRFSLKESIYKAIDPFLHRFVGFEEMEVEPLVNGDAVVRPRLKTGDALQIEAWWRRHRDWFLTCARAQPLRLAPSVEQ